MENKTELSRLGLVDEVTHVLRDAKATLFERMEMSTAMAKLEELSGKAPVSSDPNGVKKNWTDGIDLWTKMTLQDYDQVVLAQPDVKAAVEKFTQTIKDEVDTEQKQIEADYQNLTLSFDDPTLVASNSAEKSLIEEACTFLKYEIQEENREKKLVAKYFNRSSLSTVIQVGVKNLITDVSQSRDLRRPVIRKVLSLVAFRAQK